jgi:hypothetical protein
MTVIIHNFVCFSKRLIFNIFLFYDNSILYKIGDVT